jgi:hypothetical protein
MLYLPFGIVVSTAFKKLSILVRLTEKRALGSLLALLHSDVDHATQGATVFHLDE